MSSNTSRTTPAADGISADGHPRRRQILAVMCLSLLIVVVDNTVLNTVLPTLARSLHATTTDLQWITDSYTLAFAALLVFAGALGDRFGRRGALLAGLGLFAVGSAAAAMSGSPEALIAFRALMGIGGAFVMPATLSILTSVFPARERAAAIAAWSAVAGLAIVVGPTLGGFLLVHFSWHSAFWINVPLVAIALAAVWFVVPSVSAAQSVTADGRRPRLDALGSVLSATAMLALIDAVIEGPDRGWTSVTTLAELTVAVALIVAFIARELNAAYPLIDVRVFTNRAFSAAAAAVTLTFFALFGSLFALTQYLQLVHGYSPLSAGVRALPFAFGVMVAAPTSSVLAARVGARVVIPAGLTTMAAGLLTLTSVTATTGVVHMSLGVLLMGTGMGLVLAPASESIMSVLPERQRGVGSAINDTVQELGGSLGVAVIGSLVAAAYRNHLDASHLPAAVASSARGSIAAADATAAHAGPLAGPLTTTAHDAFTSAMTYGFGFAAIAALVGAVIVAIALPGKARVDDGVSNDEPVLVAA